MVTSAKTRSGLARRISGLDWRQIDNELGESGAAVTGPLLTADECRELARLFEDSERFRSHVIMARHNYGLGEYRYFDYPLPPLVQTLREELYPRLAQTANRWSREMAIDVRHPRTLSGMLKRCGAAGQTRPTPLILRYDEGGYNCLHQDLYGDVYFPLQLAVLLDRPGKDFDGGEFVLTEQRPRMQSRVQVIPLEQGDGVVFAVNERPEAGKRGFHRVRMRHGVSRIRRGRRHTLGIIFHDAR